MIPHFKIDYRAVKLNAPALEKAIANHIREVIKESAIEFLKVIAKRVPVYAGEARASFLPLAHKVGFNLEVVPTDKADARGRNTIAQGMSLGFAHLPAPQSTRNFHFEWESKSDHLYANDTFVMHFKFRNRAQRARGIIPLQQKTPWKAIASARAAFINHFDANVMRGFPSIKDFITI